METFQALNNKYCLTILWSVSDISIVSFKENAIKIIYQTNIGLSEVFCW